MKNNIWAKTILYVYKYLDRLTEAIDSLVDRQAYNSFYYSANQNNDVLKVADRMIQLIERKKKLINIKVLTDKCLENCNELLAKLLIEKYIDNDKSENIANRYNLSMRTYFRRLKDGEDNFSFFMSKFGFNQNKLDEYLKNEKWIMEVYNSFFEKSQPEEELFDFENE